MKGAVFYALSVPARARRFEQGDAGELREYIVMSDESPMYPGRLVSMPDIFASTGLKKTKIHPRGL